MGSATTSHTIALSILLLLSGSSGIAVACDGSGPPVDDLAASTPTTSSKKRISSYRIPQPKPLTGDRSTWTTRWTYFPDGDELRGLDVSPDGRHIALVQQAHWPDGGAAHNYSRRQLNRLSQRATAEPRFADPRIVIVQPGTDTRKEIDYGWSPRFSPDGRRLAYARQVKPISGKRRMVAATGTGNELVVYTIRTGEKQVWARPTAEHQFLNPIWIDDTTLVVSNCTATNGALLGCNQRLRVTEGQILGSIEVGTADDAGRSKNTGVYLWDDVDDGLALLQVGPAKSRQVKALRTLADDLVLFGGLVDSPLPAESSRAVFSSDGRWQSIDLRTGRSRTHGPSPFSSVTGSPQTFPSHNGRWILSASSPNILGDGIYLTRTLKPRSTRFWSGPGVLLDARWMNQDREVALILSRRGAGDPETRIAGDELVILKVPQAPTKGSVPAYRWPSDWRPVTP